MKVLVTGGAGFIGSHLAEALLARGDEVTIADNLSTGREGNIPAGATFVRCDIASPFAGRCALEDDWDLIYHCAASYADPGAWERDVHTNVTGTIAVVRAAHEAGARLVYFQTSLCYGLDPAVPVPIDAPLDPRGSYAVSKTAAEAYIRDSGVEYVSLRLANMYGPRNLSGPVPAFFKRLTAGESVTVVDSRRDFVYVGDLVALAIAAGDHGHGPYHAASGGDVPVATVYAAVAAALGVEGRPPDPTPRGPDDAPTIMLDPSRTATEYGWATTTPLRVGVAAAVEWYRSHGVERTFTHLSLGGASRASR